MKERLFMRLYRILSLIIVLLLLSLHSYAQDIPSSPRSRAAITRVRPALEKEIASAGLSWGSDIFIRIFKASDELEVWLKDGDKFKLFKTYPICTYGRSGLGPKLQWGDGRAPEGFYFVTPRQLNPSSSFHLSFNLGYPNAYDRARRRTGGALMVHGDCQYPQDCQRTQCRQNFVGNGWISSGGNAQGPIGGNYCQLQGAGR